jgi:hypothetical protein
MQILVDVECAHRVAALAGYLYDQASGLSLA